MFLMCLSFSYWIFWIFWIRSWHNWFFNKNAKFEEITITCIPGILKLYIKNMVSLRCIMLVKSELEKAGIALWFS